jgi:hypothetical protein
MPHDPNPIADQLARLLVAIVEHDANAVAVSKNMLTATVVLSRGLSASNRFLISELMRDSADLLEREQIERIEV